DPVAAGGALTYSLTVSNGGPSTATDVVLHDSLPAQVSGAAASGTGWSCAPPSDGAISCTRPSLGAGSAPAITLTATAPGVETLLVNTATVSETTEDPDTQNNRTDTETTVLASPPEADLSIAQTDDPDPVSAGGSLTYALTVTNAGPGGASGVTVIDTLPAGVANAGASGAGWTCGVPASGTIACMRSGLAAGSAPAIRVTLTAPASGPLTNTTEVRSSTQDPVTENNSATETTTVFAPSSGADLAIALGEIPDSVEAGQSLTYALTVTNRGPESAKGVIVTSTLPAEVKVHRVSGSGWRCARPSGVVTCKRGASGVGPLPPIMIAARAPGRGGAITISALVSSSTPDPSTDDN